MDKKAMNNEKQKHRRRAQAGNAIVMLFAAIGMAGVVTYGLNNVIRGPAVTTAEVSRRTIAENNLVATTRLAISSATHQQTNNGDCDGDGFVEPLPYRDPGLGPRPAGGGYVPATMGASMADPWGNQYGYCVWDPGTVSVADAMPDCGGATPRRLQGAPRDDQYAIAVISAGRNGIFETQCRDYADLDADNVPDDLMLETDAGSDDIVLAYSYAEANGIGGGEWRLKDGTPGTAEIGKNIALGSASNPRGAAFNDGLELGGTRGLILPRDPGDNSVTGACDAAKVNQLRLNIGDGTAIPLLEICYNNVWTIVSGGTEVAAGACTPGPWIDRDATTPDWLSSQDVLFANGIFVSVGEGNAVMTSPDGITWTQRPGAAGGEWKAVTFNGGTWVAVGYGTPSVMTSVDNGATWQPRAVPENNGWAAVTYGNGYFVAVADSGTNRVMRSVDGSTWTAHAATAGDSAWTSVVFAEGQFFATRNGLSGPTDGPIMTSPDGALWTAIDPGWPGPGGSTIFGDNEYISVQNDGYGISTDGGASWVGGTLPAGVTSMFNIAWVGGNYVAAGWGGANRLITSQDGTTWTVETPPVNGMFSGIAYGHDRIVVTAMDGALITSECAAGSGGGGSDDGEEEVAPLAMRHPLDSGLIAHWRLDERTGTTVADSVGDNHGTFVNTPQWSAQGPIGPSSLTFQHDDLDAVTIPGLLDEPENGTIALWANVAHVETNAAEFLSLGDNVALREHIDTGITLMVHNGGGVWDGVPTGVKIRGTGWRHIVGTWDQTEEMYRVYIDGMLALQDEITTPIDWGRGANTFIGRHGNNEPNYNMDGALDDIRVYDRALSPLEAQQLYESTQGSSEIRLKSPTATISSVYGQLSISSEDPHACAIKKDGSAWCWGRNVNGQIGIGSTVTPVHSPARVTQQGIHDFVQISAGRYHSCGVTADNRGWCWGQDASQELGNGAETATLSAPTLVSGGHAWSMIKGADAYSCGLRSDGAAYCWGTDTNGRLGNGVAGNQHTPFAVTGSGLYSQIDASNNHVCAIRTNGSAWCWGLGGSGQLGNGVSSTEQNPVAVRGDISWKDISVESNKTCGLSSKGSLLCWGDGFGNIPVAVFPDTVWTAIEVGRNHTCGLKTDGSVWCWGQDGDGQLGNGSITGTQATPNRVALPGPVVALAASFDRSCAMEANGALWCWGDDTEGSLGNGSTLTADQVSPSPVLGFPTFTPWLWDASLSNLEMNADMVLALGNKWISDDGSARYFGFESAGKARLRQTGSSNQLLVEAQAAAVPAQISFKKGDPAVTPVDNTANRIAEWRFNETVGVTASTSFGAFPGTLSGTTSWNPTGGRTASNGVLEFDGITGRAIVSNHASLRMAGSFTIQVWVRPDGRQTAGATILSKAHSTQHSYGLRITEDQRLEFITTNASLVSHSSVSDAILRPNAWTQVTAMIVDIGGGNFFKSVFLNGRLVSSDIIPAIAYLTNANGNLFFGSGGCRLPCNTFRGAIDDLRIYSGAFNSSVIDPMYNFQTSAIMPKAVGANGSGYFEIKQQNATATDWLGTGTPELRLTPGGDISIGALALPAQKVVVQGGVRVGFEAACTPAGEGAVRYTGNASDDPPILSCPASSWNLRSASSAGQWSDVVYGEGLFVAAAQYNGTNGIMTSPDGITWTNRTTPNRNWVSVAYGNGAFVAVTYDAYNNVLRSEDGITWTPQAISTSGWEYIQFLNGLFVATRPGDVGAVMTSPNGVNWTTRNIPVSDNWGQISYGNGLYLIAARGASHNTATSPDTINWTIGNSGIVAHAGVAFGNGVFVMGETGANMRYSYDGIIWTATTASNLGAIGNIDFSNGQFVAVSNSAATHHIGVSTDGINWTTYPAPQNNWWRGIAYGNGRYVAISEDGTNRVMTSDCAYYTPGTRGLGGLPAGARGYWAFNESTGTNASDSIGGNPGTLAGGATWAAGISGNAVSLDGVNDRVSMGSAATLDNPTATTICAWVNLPSGQNGSYQTIFGKTSNGSTSGYHIYTGNGNANSLMTLGGFGRGGSFKEKADVFPAGEWTHICGSWNGRNEIEGLRTYVNGNELSSPYDHSTAGGALYDDSAMNLVLGADGSGTGLNLMGLVDEVVLYHRALTPTEITHVMAATSAGETESYGGGPNGSCGVAWSAEQLITEVGEPDLAFGNGLFVATGGWPNYIATSADGVNWTNRTNPGTAPALDAVTYGNGLFVAVAQAAGTHQVITSPDGITWTGRTAAASSSWADVAYGNGMFMAVSGNATNNIMTSPDGITWTGQNAPVQNWTGVAYGNGRWVVTTVGQTMTSTDGTSWTAQAAPHAPWNDVVFGEGVFVGGTNANAVYSMDGLSWTNVAVAGGLSSFVYTSSGHFIGVNWSEAHIATSDDGINWTRTANAISDRQWGGIAEGNGRVVLAAYEFGVGTHTQISACARPDRYQYCTGREWRNFVRPNTTWARGGNTSVMDGSEMTNCGIRADGSVYCWGERGMWLGINDNSSNIYSTPQRLHDSSSSAGWNDWIQITTGGGDWAGTGGGSGIGIRANGTAWGWGNNVSGQLGDGTTTNRLRPVQIRDAAGTGYWNDWKQISGGYQHTCGIRGNGTLWCWGRCLQGSCGNNSMASTTQSLPLQVYDTAGTGYWNDWVSVSVSGDLTAGSHACAIRASGTAYCWGGGFGGMLGQGNTTNYSTPRAVLDNLGGAGVWSDWAQITTGPVTTCGLRNNGQIYCWGNDDDGAVGDGGGNTWTYRPGTMLANSSGGAGWSDWAYLGEMGYHGCAIRSNGTAYCWGDNDNGHLGYGANVDQRYPRQVLGTSSNNTCSAAYSDWVSITTAGFYNSCGIRADGSSWCWGYADSGALGTGSITPERWCPQRMLDP